MISLWTLPLRLSIFLFSIKVISASVAICFHSKAPKGIFNREVVGFKLWDDIGSQASQYRTIYNAKKTTMENNGWDIDVEFFTDEHFRPKSLVLKHGDSTPDQIITPYIICYAQDSSGNKGIVTYGCINTDISPEYCQTNHKTIVDSCAFEFDMGTDTLRCKGATQPK